MYSTSFDEIFDKMIGNKKEVVIKRKNRSTSNSYQSYVYNWCRWKIIRRIEKRS